MIQSLEIPRSGFNENLGSDCSHQSQGLDPSILEDKFITESVEREHDGVCTCIMQSKSRRRMKPREIDIIPMTALLGNYGVLFQKYNRPRNIEINFGVRNVGCCFHAQPKQPTPHLHGLQFQLSSAEW